MRKLVIAIDGPAGAGKSTVAQIVARTLGFTYIDTGAMYRAVTWKVQQQGINVAEKDKIVELTRGLIIRLSYCGDSLQVMVDGEDVSAAIRTPQVSRMVSEIAQIPAVREAMLYLQRQLAKSGGVVMDGRDICTYVLPDADVKIFLTASIDERAQRRWRELQAKGFVTEFEQLKQEIAQRDKMDSEREVAPLKQASDAVLLDTSNLTIEQAVEEIIKLYRERINRV